MSKFIRIFFFLISSISLNAQIIDLTYNNTSLPESIKGIKKTFYYDNNEIMIAIGNSGGAHMIGGFIELPKESLINYVSQEINVLRFGLVDTADHIESISIQVYENNFGNTPITLQTLNSNEFTDGWNVVNLTQPYVIPENTTVLIGVEVNAHSGGFSITVDNDGSYSPEYGGHILFNGNYFNSLVGNGLIADFNIQAYITDADGIDSLSDLTITNILPKSTGCLLSNSEILKLTILNRGKTTVNDSFTIDLTVNDKLSKITAVPNNFSPGTEIEINTNAFDLSEIGKYEITAKINYQDAFDNNNSIKKTLYTGNSNITIDLTTDRWPNETLWYLTNHFGNILAENQNLQKNTTYTSETCVASKGCYTFKILDEKGDGISDTGGSFSIKYNDEEIASSPADGNFGYEYTSPEIGNCVENDIELKNLQIPSYTTLGELPIKGTVYNYGKNNLTNYTVKYNINDYTSSEFKITDITIEPGEIHQFTHNIPYNFTTTGNYEISVTVLNPNNQEDESPSDNTKTKTLVVNSNVYHKTPLIEYFTSSTCIFCPSYSEKLDLFLEGPSDYSLISYHLDFPGNGDPYFIPESRNRLDYYNFTGIPKVFINGNYIPDLSQTSFESFSFETSDIEIIMNASYKNETITLKGTVKPNSALSNIDLNIAIIENITTNNVATNGETNFKNVLMNLMQFENIEFQANNNFTIDTTFNVSSTFIEEMNDLSAIIFIQDGAKNIIQSCTSTIKLNDNVTENYSLGIAEVYPNPFKDEIFIKLFNKGYHIELIDLMGKTILEVNHSELTERINTENLLKGLYFLRFTSTEASQSIRVVKH